MNQTKIYFNLKKIMSNFLLLIILLSALNVKLLAQDFWKQLPVYGGGVNSIAINQNDELFVGSEITGISNSPDNGNSWQQMNGDLNFSAIDLLIVGPNGNMFAEVRYLFANSDDDTVSIYRSNNGGGSWVKVYDCQLNEDITDMVITPNGNIFVAIYNDQKYSNRVIKSIDNGVTWVDVSIVNLYGKVECLEVDSSGYVYAGGDEGIYRSVDYGANWINIGVNYYLYSVQAIGISGQDHIFAGLGSGQIYRSIDYGETWEPIYTGSYDTEYEAITINSDGVIFAGINYTYGESDSSYILRLTDNGQNWSLNYSFSKTEINAIEANSAGYIFAGTDNSIYRSLDNGDTWTEITNGLTNFVAQNFATDSIGQTFMSSYGLPISYTSDQGENWTKISSLQNRWAQGLVFNANDDMFVGTEDGLLRSVDNGINWNLILPDTTDINVIAINLEGHIFAGVYENGVFRSTDNGATWSSINNGLIYKHGIRSFAFDTNGDAYAGSDSGGVFSSTNNGDSWTPLSNGLPDEEILALTFNSQRELFAGTLQGDSSSLTGGIYRLTSGSQIWEPVNTGLPGSAITSIVINSTGNIYAGTLDDGVFRSTNNGNSWNAVNSGLTNTNVFPLGIDNDDYIFAGTFNGVFRTVQSTASSYSVVVEPDTAATMGKDLTVSVRPSENFQPTTRRLYYRNAGESTWQYIELETASDTLNFIIPPDSVSYRGVEYYIYLYDGQNVVTYPAIDPQNNPARIQVNVEHQKVPLNFSTMTYQMISVPIQLNNPDLWIVLGDDYGDYDIKQWRILRWQTYGDSTGYFEYSSIDSVFTPKIDSTFTPGNAFWLITRSGNSFDIENGKSVDSSEPFSYTLQPGWNQVGNPFAFPVAVEMISNKDSLELPVYYDGTEYKYEQTILKPWEGYFVYNKDLEPVTISISPVEASAGRIPKKKSKLEFVSENGYLLQLSAKMENTKLIDTQNFLGFSKLASDDKDEFDLYEAPPIGEYLQVSIIEEDERFASNFKSVSEQGQQWDLEIGLSEFIKKPIEFTLIESGKLPNNFKLFALDKDYFSLIPIENNKFMLEINKEFPTRKLKLIIGTKEFAQQHNEDIPLHPIEYKLKQNYPNPFNAETIIQYQLGKRTPVVLTIYDILGRKVRTIINETQTTGYHSIRWNGLNESKTHIASGVYFYRLKAGDFVDTKKLLLVR